MHSPLSMWCISQLVSFISSSHPMRFVSSWLIVLIVSTCSFLVCCCCCIFYVVVEVYVTFYGPVSSSFLTRDSLCVLIIAYPCLLSFASVLTPTMDWLGSPRWHSGAVGSTVGSQQEVSGFKPVGRPGLLCVKRACSTHVCVGEGILPQFQRHVDYTGVFTA